MKVVLLVVGKTDAEWIADGMTIYEKRLRNYFPFAIEVVAGQKTKSREAESVKREEARLILSRLAPDDYVALLDERGEQRASVAFADWLQKRFNAGSRRLVFVVGGAWGFDASVYARANEQIALSAMTFSHQMIRPFFLEQLYRAMTILRGEPYHNE